MKHPLLIIFSGICLCGLAVTGWYSLRNGGERLPDEKRIAMLLLNEQRSGPGYFLPEPNAEPDEQGILWTSPSQAMGQIDRILKERRLGEGSRNQIQRLIAKTCEPHPSRAVGGERINLARLNVALDGLP